MKIDDYQKIVLLRSEEMYFPLEKYGPEHYAARLQCEAGELLQPLLKGLEGKPVDMDNQKEEIGDVVLYAALTAARHGFTLSECLTYAFNKASAKIGSQYFINRPTGQAQTSGHVGE